MIATIDTVNVYTPATQLDVAEEMQYAKRLCQESRDIITQAQFAQTQGGYNADSFQPVLLKKGTKIYRLCVSSEQLCLGKWYMSEKSFINSGRDYFSVYRGLQVSTDGFSGTRYKIAEYIIDQDIYVAGGIVKNNFQYGEGGYFQYFINNWEQIIETPSNIYDLINLP